MENKPVALNEPFDRFDRWYKKAEKSETGLPEAMTLATVSKDGRPSARMVLLKGWGHDGFVFYTNLESRKAQQLSDSPVAALVFYWKSLRRQVRVEGHVEAVSDAEADDYFASRPRSSQIGAWASRQSRPMQGRFEFEAAIAKYTAEFGMGEVLRPDHWSGFKIVPDRIEFWKDRQFRLHERIDYQRCEGGWTTSMLYP